MAPYFFEVVLYRNSTGSQMILKYYVTAMSRKQARLECIRACSIDGWHIEVSQITEKNFLSDCEK